MIATQWIAEHGTKMRSITAAQLRRVLRRKKGECTWCGQAVKSPRRNWCSDSCVEAFQGRCDVATIRRRVFKRDNGVCHQCGRDTVEMARFLNGLKAKLRRKTHSREYHRGFSSRPPLGHRATTRRSRAIKVLAEIQRRTGNGRHCWEADHIVPVVEGGGLCGLEGYRTLCVRCHKSETKKLHARRARKKLFGEEAFQ